MKEILVCELEMVDSDWVYSLDNGDWSSCTDNECEIIDRAMEEDVEIIYVGRPEIIDVSNRVDCNHLLDVILDGIRDSLSSEFNNGDYYSKMDDDERKYLVDNLRMSISNFMEYDLEAPDFHTVDTSENITATIRDGKLFYDIPVISTERDVKTFKNKLKFSKTQEKFEGMSEDFHANNVIFNYFQRFQFIRDFGNGNYYYDGDNCPLLMAIDHARRNIRVGIDEIHGLNIDSDYKTYANITYRTFLDKVSITLPLSDGDVEYYGLKNERANNTLYEKLVELRNDGREGV